MQWKRTANKFVFLFTFQEVKIVLGSFANMVVKYAMYHFHIFSNISISNHHTYSGEMTVDFYESKPSLRIIAKKKNWQ